MSEALHITDPGPWPVLLAGWDQRSVWGWDPPTRSFYAQLWRNGEPADASDAPHVAIGTGIDAPVRHQRDLAQRIAEATGHPAHAVDQVLAESLQM